jgi:hypothetical protein
MYSTRGGVGQLCPGSCFLHVLCISPTSFVTFHFVYTWSRDCSRLSFLILLQSNHSAPGVVSLCSRYSTPCFSFSSHSILVIIILLRSNHSAPGFVSLCSRLVVIKSVAHSNAKLFRLTHIQFQLLHLLFFFL